ncbi:MAG: site-2 protease family protein [Elusimicrobiaceae bacterium]|jgi:regulator of sigma E protease|nr:site-2 protease family protein [Elusimicrobiaceae bacterium]MBT3955401.1 site-2 protease family protein [Elusimicrobiaceae bacterium]MBT4007678.1 site-2 protease family protein [Elusimicrobiaceae bacterium]MBT4402312.1 site-2 protease family protein [Elusimicrobiaceae bacterium]MBT4439545.1 site-2 protease family protein [Elusimicrobiaceae bacterium]
MILSVVGVVFALGLIIFIHELGHFLACRWLGIRVEEFALGFGKKLWYKKHGDTEYQLRAIPFGGFVKPAGEFFPSENTKHKPDEFCTQPWYKKLIMVLSGSAMNYVLAFLIFTSLIFFMGKPATDFQNATTKIGDIAIDYPAYQAGIKAGDTILSVNGQSVDKWIEMAGLIHKTQGDVNITYQHNNEIKKVAITPQIDNTTQNAIIGIAPHFVYEKIGLVGSVQAGAYQCWFWTYYSLKTLATKIYKKEKVDLAGPVGIVTMISKAVHKGFADYMAFIGLISVAIGMFNLFPIPILDGGHAVFFMIEGIRRKRVPEKVVEKASMVGLTLLVGLLIFATYNDVIRMKKPNKKQEIEVVETGK